MTTLFPVIFLSFAFLVIFIWFLLCLNEGLSKGDTPVPDPHSGEFKGEYGTLSFIKNYPLGINFSGDFVNVFQDCLNNINYRYMFTLADQGDTCYDFADASYLTYPDCETRIAFSCPRFPSKSRIYLNPIWAEIGSTVFEKIADYINDEVEESNVL